MDDEKIRVFFAEDQDYVVEALKILLERKNNIQFVGRAANEDDLFHRLANTKVDVLFLDILSSVDQLFIQIKKLSNLYKEMKIVVFTVTENRHIAVKAIENGAKGYIGKSISYPALINAIQSIFEGDMMIKVKPLKGEDEDLIKIRESLSPFEKQIVCLVARGFTTEDIANFLGYAPKTIEEHRRLIIKKLNEYGVTNSASLAYRAAEANICEGVKYTKRKGKKFKA